MRLKNDYHTVSNTHNFSNHLLFFVSDNEKNILNLVAKG